MKPLRLLSAVVAAILFLSSFTGKSIANPSSDAEGKLAYTLNGVKVVVKPPSSSIYINEVSHNGAKGSVKIKVTIFPSGELFDFLVADKGTTDVVHYKPTFGEHKVEAVYMAQTGHNFYGDHVSVTINALDAAHVAGTFSGTFVAEGKTVTITDGSFDLPMHAKR